MRFVAFVRPTKTLFQFAYLKQKDAIQRIKLFRMALVAVGWKISLGRCRGNGLGFAASEQLTSGFWYEKFRMHSAHSREMRTEQPMLTISMCLPTLVGV